MRPQQAIVLGLCWGKGVKGEEKDEKCLCRGRYLTCILKRIYKQGSQLSYSSCLHGVRGSVTGRQEGPGVPRGLLSSGDRAPSPGSTARPAWCLRCSASLLPGESPCPASRTLTLLYRAGDEVRGGKILWETGWDRSPRGKRPVQ